MSQFQVGQRVEVIMTDQIREEFATSEQLTGTVAKVFNERGTGIMVNLDDGPKYMSFSPNEIRPEPKRHRRAA